MTKLPDDHFLKVGENLEPQHNYEKAMKILWANGLLSPFAEVWIHHEDSCSLHDGGLCDCECEIEVNRKLINVT